MSMSHGTKARVWLGAGCMVVACWALAGCNTGSTNGTGPAGTASEKTASAEKQDGFKDLEPADLAIAEKQKVCPVSGEPLGSMGKPFKVSYKGRAVFLCCDGCKADFDKEPEKYLTKIDSAKK